MCDIDHFKQLNDQFGHAAGDEVLRDVAKLFQQNLRQQDIASRTGGEEFLLIFPQTEYYNAYLVAEKIRVAFEQYRFLKPHPSYRVTASFGVAQCHNASDFSKAVLLADQQLYQSKAKGRNQVS
jgi:diguanylate cyclase (GGDEF)-like protein